MLCAHTCACAEQCQHVARHQVAAPGACVLAHALVQARDDAVGVIVHGAHVLLVMLGRGSEGRTIQRRSTPTRHSARCNAFSAKRRSLPVPARCLHCTGFEDTCSTVPTGACMQRIWASCYECALQVCVIGLKPTT